MNKQEIEKLKKKFPEGAYSEGVEVPPLSERWMKGVEDSDFEDDAVPEEMEDADEEEDKDDQK